MGGLQEKKFDISRYKVGGNPMFRGEYHWDIGEPLGTAKPLAVIEKCPFNREDYIKETTQDILYYLDALEESNPIIKGYNTLLQRKEGAIKFAQHLSRKPIEGKMTISEKFFLDGKIMSITIKNETIQLEIESMGNKFDSHDFITSFAKKNQKIYIKALSDIESEHPFQVFHSYLGKRVKEVCLELGYKPTDHRSKDIFGIDASCTLWEKA